MTQPVQPVNHTLNSSKTVAVSTDWYWMPIDKDTPRSVKLLLLGAGGVAAVGVLGSNVDKFWVSWVPMPKRRPVNER